MNRNKGNRIPRETPVSTPLNIGSYVRNTLSGKFGYVSAISADRKKITVLTINRTTVSWNARNVTLIKDATP